MLATVAKLQAERAFLQEPGFAYLEHQRSRSLDPSVTGFLFLTRGRKLDEEIPEEKKLPGKERHPNETRVKGHSVLKGTAKEPTVTKKRTRTRGTKRENGRE